MTDKIKGITIELNGDTTGLGKALADVNKRSKDVQNELKDVERLLKFDPTNTELLAQKQELLAKQVSLATEKLGAMEAAQEDVKKLYASGEIDDGQYRKFERDLIGASQALEKLDDSADDAGKETKQAGNEAEDAGKQADKSSKGWDGLSTAFGVAAGAAAAGAAAVAAVGAAAVAGVKALTDCSVGAAAYADDMLTLSAQTGIAVDDLQAYSYVAGIVDVDTAVVTKSMAKNIKQMTSSSKDVAAAYDALGVAVKNADGTLRDSDAVYWECIDALGKIDDETTRDSLAMQIFGRSAQELNPLIDRGSQGIKELTDNAREMGAVLSDEQLSKLGGLQDNLDYLTAGAEAAKNALGLALTPALTELSGAGVDILGDLTAGLADADGDFDKISEVITSALGKALDAMDELLPNFLDLGMDIVSAIAGSILKNLPQITTSASNILNQLLKNIIGGLPKLVKGGLDILKSLLDGISDNVPLIVSSALEIINVLISSLGDLLPMLLDIGLQIITELALGLSEALPDMIPQIVDIMLSIVEILIDNIPMLIDCAAQLITGLTDGLIEAIPVICEHMPEIIAGVVGALIESLPQLLDCGAQLIGALAKGMLDNGPRLIEAIGESIEDVISEIGIKGPGMTAAFEDIGGKTYDMVQDIVGKIGEVWSGLTDSVIDNVITPMFDIGRDIVSSLWDGIMSLDGWLEDKVGGFIGGITDKIGGFFGVDSKYTAAGDRASTGGSSGRRDGSGKEKSVSVTQNFSGRPTQDDLLTARRAAVRTVNDLIQ